MTAVQRVLIAGSGVIAVTHAAAAARLPGPPDVLAADPSASAREAFSERVPGARLFDESAEMLAVAPEPGDVVVVATPPFTHAPLVRDALRSGRHVLCEKPLAMSVPEAEELTSLASERGLLLGCCSCRFLGLPTTARVRDLISHGGIGRMYHVTFVNRLQRRRSGVEYQSASGWFLDASRSGGGVLMDWGPYDFAALDELLEPLRVDIRHAFVARAETAIDPDTTNDVEQHVGATLVYHLADGTRVPVTYERSACTHGAERATVEVEGTRGSTEWDWLMLRQDGTVSHRTDREGAVHVEHTTHPREGSIDFSDKPLHFFAGTVAGEPTPIRTGLDALFVFSCLRAVYQCAATGRPTTVERRN